MKSVLVAMSGGVDSSVAALLLRDQGYQVVGCTMQLWDHRRNPNSDGEPQFGRCCSLDDVYDARRVAEQLGMRYYVLNLEKQFQQQVVQPFIGEYLSGRTPLPCTLCNTFLKFDRLLLFACQVGIDKIATGHYARLARDEEGRYVLLKSRDEGKDQSYFLFELTQEQLAHTLFPVGDYPKEEIRRIAGACGLSTAQKRDSQEICFVPDGDYASFIRRHAHEVNTHFGPILNNLDRPGPIIFRDGTVLGTHSGLYRFTVGQRRGLRVACGRPLYVLSLDRLRNAVIAGYKEDLFSEGLIAERVNWIGGAPPPQPIRAQVRIRSRHKESSATISTINPGENERRVRVDFDVPQMAVTPGQAAVFYDGPRVLGGGWISTAIGATTVHSIPGLSTSLPLEPF
ncbi:MAG: tRNA 2-thiouridine(34) synthase MnmA [Acidobacteria bacterium]|nr:tRNA 2-thiouridine(34) synthase MnmA [Acidobacteriota bacterium]